MRVNNLRNSYDKIKTTKDMDKNIIDNITSKINTKTKRSKKTLSKYIAVASCLVLVTLISANAIVSTAENSGENNTFTNIFRFFGKSYKLEGEYLDIDTTNFDKEYGDYKYTMSQAEDMLGLKLLKSDTAYKPSENKLTYDATCDSKGNVYCVGLSSLWYDLGDTKITEKNFVDTDDEKDQDDGLYCIKYHEGKVYKSPVSCSISLRFKQKDKCERVSGEIDYEGYDIDYSEHTFMKKTYQIKSLNVPAIMFKSKGGEPEPCQCVDRPYDTSGTNATIKFIYDNICYTYTAVVPYRVLENYVENLHY